MLKAALTTILSALVFQTGALAQIYVKSPGNVGIGINTPAEKLHVNGKIRIEAIDNVLSFISPTGTWQYLSFNRGSNRQAYFGLNDGNDFLLNKETDGNIIFKVNHGKFYVQGGDVDQNIGGAISLAHTRKDGSNQGKEWVLYNMTGIYGEGLQFWEYDRFGCGVGLCGPRFTIHDNGNVGIGTTNPGYKLQVEGDVKAATFRANANNYPDYVFDSTYQVPSLQEVETYIKQNHHLPDVPSEEEVKQHGINLSDHQVILLKKIEELTLYTIAQDKQLLEQATTQKAQQEKLLQLEKALEAIVAENNKLKEALKGIKTASPAQ